MTNSWRPAFLICLSLHLLLGAALMSAALAQEATSPQAATRTESLEQQQQEKARKLRPEEPGRAE